MTDIPAIESASGVTANVRALVQGGIPATNPVVETILSRSAAKYYDPAATLSDEQISELVRITPRRPVADVLDLV